MERLGSYNGLGHMTEIDTRLMYMYGESLQEWSYLGAKVISVMACAFKGSMGVWGPMIPVQLIVLDDLH